MSPLFAEEVFTNGSDANRVIELGAADGGDGSFAPNSSTVLSGEGQLQDSSTPAAESTGATSHYVESIEDLSVKNKGTFSDGATYVFACNNASRKVWDVVGGSFLNGANVQMYSSNMTKAQRWLVHEDEDEFLTLLMELMSSNIRLIRPPHSCFLRSTVIRSLTL